jgi:hypothetical protein
MMVLKKEFMELANSMNLKFQFPNHHLREISRLPRMNQKKREPKIRRIRRRM